MASTWAATRIRNQRDFREIFRKGRRNRGQRITLIRLAHTQASRLGVVVTKKTGSAVVRNRWKRVFRDEFQAFRKESPKSGDYLVLVHRGVSGKPQSADREELSRFFRRSL